MPSVFRILVVGGDPGGADADAVEESLRHGRVPCAVVAAPDGETALDVLLRRRGHEHAPIPDLVLLHHALPGAMTGLDVLRDMQAHGLLSAIPAFLVSDAGALRPVPPPDHPLPAGFLITPLREDAMRHLVELLVHLARPDRRHGDN